MVRNLHRSAGIALVTSIAVVLLATSDLGQAQEQRPTAETNAKSMPVKSGRIAVNGLSYYYEIHGQGEPLLMLHGGLGSIGMFGPVLPMLANSRRVIGVDLHGHGRTGLGEREISLIDMGDDMAALLRGLGYSQVDALGYSLGGRKQLRAAQSPRCGERRECLSNNGRPNERQCLVARFAGSISESNFA